MAQRSQGGKMDALLGKKIIEALQLFMNKSIPITIVRQNGSFIGPIILTFVDEKRMKCFLCEMQEASSEQFEIEIGNISEIQIPMR